MNANKINLQIVFAKVRSTETNVPPIDWKAFCMANANNQERHDFVKQYPNDNGFILNTLKRQGYDE